MSDYTIHQARRNRRIQSFPVAGRRIYLLWHRDHWVWWYA